MTRLPPWTTVSLELHAYRLVQEGLTNVAKHTRGGTATVTVAYQPDGLTVEISDDAAADPV
jgi:signal transduction histidine kinase